MQITIDIPEEFVRDFKEDKFADSLKRLKSDAHLLAGNYEKETADMLMTAFQNAQFEDVPATPPHPRWMPKEDEKYYMVCGDGTPYLWHWHGCCDDGTSINRYTIGNVFHTKDEAAFTGERLRVLAEMREWAGNWDDPVILAYNMLNREIVTQHSACMCTGGFRFSTVYNATECIKAVGKERIKKYYFMIPDFN